MIRLQEAFFLLYDIASRFQSIGQPGSYSIIRKRGTILRNSLPPYNLPCSKLHPNTTNMLNYSELRTSHGIYQLFHIRPSNIDLNMLPWSLNGDPLTRFSWMVIFALIVFFSFIYIYLKGFWTFRPIPILREVIFSPYQI